MATTAELYPVPVEPRVRRLESIDMLRGLLMILMALDHTRDFFTNIKVDPVDPLHSWPLLFATRWITHLCAPGFIALAGCSVYLQKLRGKSNAELRRLLVTRGLWLMLLEPTVISFGWAFGFEPFLQVIWAVGFSMVALGLLIGLPTAAIGGLGAAITVLHNLLDPIRANSLGAFANEWKMLHELGFLMAGGRPVALIAYPILPWFGVICLGYAFGPVAAKTGKVRRRISLQLAAAQAVAFVALRVWGGYGDAARFERLGTWSRDTMSLLNVTKYPPSLDYVLATFTVLLLLYAAFDLAAERGWAGGARRVLETFGRVPFFYYVPHIYLLHMLVVVWTAAEGLNWRGWLNHSLVSPAPPGWGFGLGVVYAVWIAVVAALYWPCTWFAGVKQRRRDWWLSYL